MERPLKVDCAFARIDVKRGRAALLKRLKKGENITLQLTATLGANPSAWNNDGTSIEFGAVVTNAEEV